MENNDWIKSEEAAKILGISRSMLYNLTSKELIPFYKFGRRNRYKKSELNKFLGRIPKIKN